MPQCLVIADLPDVTLDGGKHISWVQLAKQGKFKDPRYGAFSITQADFDKWLANYAEFHAPDAGRAGLPIDVDHAPEKGLDKGTDAAGWVVALEQRGNELWGQVEWTDLGVELVGSKRYRYLSPSYAHDFADEQGKTHGTALVGVGLTNRPFLTMATVSLSAAPFVAMEVGDPDPAPSLDSPAAMNPLEKIAEKLGLSKDADEATVLAKLAEVTAVPGDQGKSLDQLALTEGKVVLSVDDVTQLRADAQAGRDAAKQLSEQRFETAFDKALSDGRVTPAEKDSQKELYEVAPAATLKALESRPKIVALDTTNGKTGTSAASGSTAPGADGPVDEDRVAMHQRAVQLMAEHDGLGYLDAVERAEREGVTA